jgi:hypothetical protein
MQAEHLILCGEAFRLTESRDAKIHRLNVSGPACNIDLRISDIRRLLLTNVPDALTDLLEIATYIYCADASVRRGGSNMAQFGKDWRRQFRFVIPVRLPELWSSAAIATALSETLSFLSDDFYAFDFCKLREPVAFQSYLEINGNEGSGFKPDGVVLFSGGLDSLAGVIEELSGSERRVALVSHRSAPKIASHQRDLIDKLKMHFGSQRLFHVPVWIRRRQAIGPEFTHRSRSFLFAALAFVVARTFNLLRFQFFENGVVSLNLPIVPHELGARASRTTHPQVIEGFSTLFSTIARASFEVENPFRWNTKAEVIRSIAGRGCAELIPQTISCTRVREMRVAQTHCGICSQCLDRRFAVLAAGLEAQDPQALYRLDPLLDDIPAGDARTMAESYIRSASEIERMNDIAFFSRFGEASRAVRFLEGTADEAGRKIFELYKRHATEVCGVFDRIIRSHASELRTHSLPESCLVVLALRRGQELNIVVPPKPVRDPAETEYAGEFEQIRYKTEYPCPAETGS